MCYDGETYGEKGKVVKARPDESLDIHACIDGDTYREEKANVVEEVDRLDGA